MKCDSYISDDEQWKYLENVIFFSDCHTKVHKDHYDKNEEFIAYCKGK